MSWMTWVSNPGDFSPKHPDWHRGLQPSIQWVPEFFRSSKAANCEVDHSPPPIAEVKNEWSYTFTPPVSIHHLTGSTSPFLPVLDEAS